MTLTDKDLKNIKELVEITFDEKLEEATEEMLATKDDIRHLPTKEEFYKRTDEMMGELKAIRESQTILTGKVYEDHEPRIVKIEKKLQIQPLV